MINDKISMQQETNFVHLFQLDFLHYIFQEFQLIINYFANYEAKV